MTAEQRERELRNWAARQLKIPEVPADEWRFLVDERWVGSVFNAEDEGGPEEAPQARQELLDALKRERQRQRERSRSAARAKPQQPTPRRVIPLSPAEDQRARLASNALGREADRLPPVRDFRRRWLDGLLDNESAREVVAMLASDAPDDDGFLRELAAVAEWLAARFPWEKEAAARFVLSIGPAPWVEPIRAWTQTTDYGERVFGRITLEVEPWVGDETVRRAYRSLQAFALGKDNRRLDERALMLLQFVADRVGDVDRGLRGERLRSVYEDWEREHGGQFHFLDQYKLKRAHDSARRRMLRPEYTVLTDEPVPRGRPAWVRHGNLQLFVLVPPPTDSKPDSNARRR